MELGLEEPDDWWEVEALYDLCFAPGRTALSSYRLRDDVPAVPELCVVLWEDTGPIIGAIRQWPVKVGGIPCLLLGPVAVHPTHQGEGLAGILIRAANGRPLTVMFPLITEMSEFQQARSYVLRELHREKSLGHPVPSKVEIGAMMETPSLAYAPKAFFELTDFISVGGNDLKQFFFAADRENELVRRRYDTLNLTFLAFLEQVVARCAEAGTTLSFCGEDAGRPIEALALAAIGFRTLSMRPASVGPVKALLRKIDLTEARTVIDKARAEGAETARPALMDWLASQGV